MITTCSIHYYYSIRGTWPRWRQHDKVLNVVVELNSSKFKWYFWKTNSHNECSPHSPTKLTPSLSPSRQFRVLHRVKFCPGANQSCSIVKIAQTIICTIVKLRKLLLQDKPIAQTIHGPVQNSLRRNCDFWKLQSYYKQGRVHFRLCVCG